MDFDLLDKINVVMEFLIKMDSAMLAEELYDYLNGQIFRYVSMEETRVLEITLNQLKLFGRNNLSLDFFAEPPFNVDAVVVCENSLINYRYIDSEVEVNKFVSGYDNPIVGQKGLYFLTSGFNGCLGDGIYVCDRDNDESNYIYNGFINQKRNIMYRNSQEYVYYADGVYNGYIKRCVWGSLKGIVLIKDSLKIKPIMSKEDLSLYGTLESSVDDISSDDKFIEKVNKYLPNYMLKLSSVKLDILSDAKG